MTLLITAEQQSLRESLAGMLAKSCISTPEEMAGNDELQWQTLARQMDLAGLLVPIEHGGSGASISDLVVVMEEFGFALYGGPFLASSVLAVAALTASGDTDAQSRYLPRIADGSLTASLVTPTSLTAPSPLEATKGGTTMNGRCSAVLDGATAQILVVLAPDAQGVSLFSVDLETPGVVREPLRSLDLARPAADVILTDTPAERIGPRGAGPAIMEQIAPLAYIALAAEQIGGARRCLTDATDYAKLRYQFGRPIGSFQAIKHCCADMFYQATSGQVAVRAAANAMDQHSSDTRVFACVARIYCSEAYVECAQQNLQIHGGMGFTWEADCHRHYRRALSSASLFGSPDVHREKIAATLLP